MVAGSNFLSSSLRRVLLVVNVRAPSGLKKVTAEEPRSEGKVVAAALAVVVVLVLEAVARPACAGLVGRKRHLERLRVLRCRFLARGEAEVFILTVKTVV